MIIGAQECTSHCFVGAGLSLLNANAVVDGLGLGHVTLGGPAVDQCVGNVGSHLNFACKHVLDDFFGVGDTVVGDHGFKEGLVEAWLEAHTAVGDNGVEDFARAGEVVQDAALGVH